MLALGVRLVYVLQIDASPLFAHPVVDAETYAQHAARLAAGNWLGRGEGPFWQPPLYPYLLGLIKTLFPGSFFYAVRFIQALFGAISCVLVYWMGRQVFQPVVGLVAALAAALYGPLIFFDGELLPATLATFLNLAGLALLVRSLQRPSSRGFLAAGVVFGLAALAVATVLSFVGAGAVWIFWRCRRGGLPVGAALKGGGGFLLGAALAIGPVALRNYVIGGDVVLISYNAGVNFYIGNNPDYERTVAVRPGWEWDDLVGLPLEAGIEGPSAKSKFFLGRAWDYIRSRPVDYLGLLLRKTWLFWHGDEVGRNQDIYFWRNYSSLLALLLWKWVIAFPFGIAGPLALAGVLLAVRHQGLSLPVVFAVVYSLSVIAVFVNARYRLPVIPVLLLFASYGAHWMYSCLREHRPGPAGLSLAGLGVFLVLANYQLKPMNMQGDAAIHYNLGNAYARQGRREEGRQEFARAVELDSTYWQAWLNLGSLEALQGDMLGAIRIFERVLEANPERVEVWLNLAHAHLGMRNQLAALRAYQEALKVDPQQSLAYVELIGLYLWTGDFQGAEKVLRQAIEYHPQEATRLRSMYESMKDKVLNQ